MAKYGSPAVTVHGDKLWLMGGAASEAGNPTGRKIDKKLSMLPKEIREKKLAGKCPKGIVIFLPALRGSGFRILNFRLGCGFAAFRREWRLLPAAFSKTARCSEGGLLCRIDT